MKKDLSIKKILSTDYVSFISWLAPLVFFVSYLLTQNRYAAAAVNLLYLTIGCAGVGLMIIHWRIWFFNTLLDQGILVEGQIMKVFFYHARGTITYTYLHRNQQYTKKILIHKALHNFQYQIGDSITVAVDPEDPNKSFILEFFEKSAG
jgi:ribosomal protein S17